MWLSSDPGDDLGRSPWELENHWGVGTGTYSKSVTFLSSVTGLKATTFFLSPITQAESPELANTRPGRGDTADRGHLAWGSRGCPVPPASPCPTTAPQPSAHPCGRPPAASPTSTAPPSLPAWSHSCGQRGSGLPPGDKEMAMSSPPNSWGQRWPVWPCPPYLLEVAQDVNPAVEDAFALGGVEVVEELGGVVLVALLITGGAEGRHWGGCSLLWHPQGVPPCSPKHLFFFGCFVLPEAQSPSPPPQQDPAAGVGTAAEAPSTGLSPGPSVASPGRTPCARPAKPRCARAPLSGCGKSSAPASLPATGLGSSASVPGGPQLTAAPALSGYPSSFCRSSAPRWPAR